jgi:hypothetical protein
MRCECLDRLIDPQTKKTVACYGWLREREEQTNKYWVSIGNRTPEFFSDEETAKQFYNDSIKPLEAGFLRRRGLRGYGNNKPKAQAVTAGR